ncbi:DUF805 domain-containing protein [Periweissella cryptocerci]|uniref:DUF805 domain-containing protein n=1 Tax=Periweissella cryptocerci TaxID=2506420 RepID=A0A4P6YSY4_9LACO|nr:SMI1/KNR4 family protein [Periweissella cryptocerci]QBO35762.1 DUF805 domain-containing protein [Periweissella cryptocerci]
MMDTLSIIQQSIIQVTYDITPAGVDKFYLLGQAEADTVEMRFEHNGKIFGFDRSTLAESGADKHPNEDDLSVFEVEASEYMWVLFETFKLFKQERPQQVWMSYDINNQNSNNEFKYDVADENYEYEEAVLAWETVLKKSVSGETAVTNDSIYPNELRLKLQETDKPTQTLQIINPDVATKLDNLADKEADATKYTLIDEVSRELSTTELHELTTFQQKIDNTFGTNNSKRWELLFDLLKLKYPEKMQELPAGATDAQIKEAEIKLGFKIPEPLKVMYRQHNGEGTAAMGIFASYEMVSLDNMFFEKSFYRDANTYEINQVGTELRSNTKWLPFATVGDGSTLFVDLATPDGKVMVGWPEDISALGETLEEFILKIFASVYFGTLGNYPSDEYEQRYLSDVDKADLTVRFEFHDELKDFLEIFSSMKDKVKPADKQYTSEASTQANVTVEPIVYKSENSFAETQTPEAIPRHSPRLIEATIGMWKNAFNFTGKTTRAEYWLAIIGNVILFIGVEVILGVLQATFGENNSVVSIVMNLVLGFSIVLVYLSLPLNIRRFRDVGWTPFLILTLFLGPVGVMVCFIAALMNSKEFH